MKETQLPLTNGQHITVLCFTSQIDTEIINSMLTFLTEEELSYGCLVAFTDNDVAWLQVRWDDASGKTVYYENGNFSVIDGYQED